MLGPQDPLVRGLLGVVDCNVSTLARGGYAALFQPSSAFSGVLTAALTVFVGLIGYRLLLGRGRLGVGEFTLAAVKLGAVLALATQWGTYQTVVYDTLFHGPEQLATAVLDGMQPRDSEFRGNVFTGLQRAFDDLSSAAGSYANHQTPLGAQPTAAAALAAPGAPVATPATQASGLMSGGGLGAALLTGTAAVLLMSTLGVLLAAKIVLGVLLGLGPLFIALLLFEATRGVFEGWLRASLGFAFAPLMATLLTGVALTMLEPSLVEMEQLRAQGVFPLEPVYTVTLLVLVFAGVSLGMLVASGVVAAGFRLPARPERTAAGRAGDPGLAAAATPAGLSRSARVAEAATALDRRDAQVFASGRAQGAGGAGAEDRRTVIAAGAVASRGGAAEVPAETRLGQGARRSASPRAPRSTAVAPRTA